MKYTTITIMLLFLLISLYGCEQEKLTYIHKESIHHEFIIDSGKVEFHDEITLKNNTDETLLFTMKADIAKEKKIGLSKEEYAYAYDDNSDKYKVFEILPKAKKTYKVKFIASQGDNDTKSDRNPPTM